MSDTKADMREYRFLDDKRKSGGLSADEDQRWQYLGVALGIVVPPEEPQQPQGQWGADGLWYPFALGPEAQAQGVWDPGALGLGYEPNSGAWWDPTAQQWWQPPAYDAYAQQSAPPAVETAPAVSQAQWAAAPLPAEKSLGAKAPWKSVTEAPAPAAEDGPVEVSDDEVMEVSDDEVSLVSEPEPAPVVAAPRVKLPPAPKLPPLAPKAAAPAPPRAPEPEPSIVVAEEAFLPERPQPVTVHLEAELPPPPPVPPPTPAPKPEPVPSIVVAEEAFTPEPPRAAPIHRTAAVAPPPPEPEPSIVVAEDAFTPEPPRPAPIQLTAVAMPSPGPAIAAPPPEDFFAPPAPIEPALPEPAVEAAPPDDFFAPPGPAAPEPVMAAAPPDDLFAPPAPAEPAFADPAVEEAAPPEDFFAPPALLPEPAVEAAPPDDFFAPPAPAEPAFADPAVEEAAPPDDLFAPPALPPEPAAEAVPTDDLFGPPPAAASETPADVEVPTDDFFAPSPPVAPPRAAAAPATPLSDLFGSPLDAFSETEPIPAPVPSAPLPITVDDAEFRASARFGAAPPPPLATEEDEPALEGTIEEEPELSVVDDQPLPVEATLDLGGSASDQVELASNSDFIAGGFDASAGLADDAGAGFGEGDASLLVNQPAAMLANEGVQMGSEALPEDDAPLQLASNIDFIDNPELTGTGESWQKAESGLELDDGSAGAAPPAAPPPEGEDEGEGDVVQGVALEEDAPDATGPHQRLAAAGALLTSPARPAPSAPFAGPGAVAFASRGPSPRPPTGPTAPPRPAPAAFAAPPAAPGGYRLEGEHRVIIHTLTGQVKRGALKNQDLAAPQLDLDGPVKELLPTATVKAVFFMLPPGAPPPAQDGRKVSITFVDGRQLGGFAQAPEPAAPGLFVVPTDTRSNTARIFVYRHAVKSVAVD